MIAPAAVLLQPQQTGYNFLHTYTFITNALPPSRKLVTCGFFVSSMLLENFGKGLNV
jgi:hypothetical protein